MHKKNAYLPILICILLTSLFTTASAQTTSPESDCRYCHENLNPIITMYTLHHAGIPVVIPNPTDAPYGTSGQIFKCESCHATETSCGSVTYIIERDCTVCHVAADPHHTPAPSTCVSCHESDRPVDPHPQGPDCIECHFDAGNSWPGATYGHTPVPSSCNTCHEIDRPADPHPQVRDCIECHFSTGTSWLGATYDHVSTGAVQPLSSCINCHGSEGQDLVESIHNSNCGLCHLNPNGGGLMVEPYETIAPLGGDCSVCHGTMAQIHPNANHTATPGSGSVVIFADTDHDDAGWNGERPYFDVEVDCNLCHSTDLPLIHGQKCETCHPSPVDSLGTWNGSCGQSACHPTIHENSIPAHWPFESAYNNSGNDCNVCHNQSWDVPQSSCLNCHDATYGSNDTTPPVTTSDARATYIGPAGIDFSITDEGRVGVGTTFYRLDDAAELTGSDMIVYTPGSHTLEFRSMDQSGNFEAPATEVAFTIIEDTTPPTTTSNVYTSYYNGAYITLTATDNSSLGVKTTYYQLNNGPIKTGRTVSVPAVNGVLSYELIFWSEDWSGNSETPKSANFTVTSGTVTLRLVWGNSDITGSPCGNDPEAWADWYIRRGGYLAASGGGGCPDWSGVDDVIVPVSPTPYSVSIDWWDSYYGWDDNTYFPSVLANTPGEIIRLIY